MAARGPKWVQRLIISKLYFFSSTPIPENFKEIEGYELDNLVEIYITKPITITKFDKTYFKFTYYRFY